MAEDTQKRLIRYLNDAYASEVGAIKAIESVLAEATDPDLKQALSNHLVETQGHADKLTTRILALGGDKSEAKAIVDEIIAMTSHLTNILHDKDDKQTQDLIKSISLEGFEIGTYTALKSFATAIGDSQTADLADSILAEEKKAFDKLVSLVPQVSVLAVRQTTSVA